MLRGATPFEACPLHRTFTTSYKGTLRTDSHAEASASGQLIGPRQCVFFFLQSTELLAAAAEPRPFCACPCKQVHACTLPLPERVPLSRAGRSAEWVASPEPLDKGLLLARDPILFYDEVPLYESELDDNGSSQLHVKVAPRSMCCVHFFLGEHTESCADGRHAGRD